MKIKELDKNELNEIRVIIGTYVTDDLQSEIFDKLVNLRPAKTKMSDDDIDQLNDWYNDTTSRIVMKLKSHFKALVL